MFEYERQRRHDAMVRGKAQPFLSFSMELDRWYKKIHGKVELLYSKHPDIWPRKREIDTVKHSTDRRHGIRRSYRRY